MRASTRAWVWKSVTSLSNPNSPSNPSTCAEGRVERHVPHESQLEGLLGELGSLPSRISSGCVSHPSASRYCCRAEKRTKLAQQTFHLRAKMNLY